ncbi:MAG: hypothetical protein HQ558_02260 [Candidatus Omnitrophica bacterium]|nr:hypothetical protein [Candidatus Omnitrophota bacterium]
MKKRRIVLGIVIGIAVGILLDVLLIIDQTPMVVILIYPVLLPILVSVGIFILLAKKRMIPALPWWSIVVVALISWPIAFRGPTLLIERHLRLTARREIPMYPSAEKLSTSINPFSGSGQGPRFESCFNVNADFEEVADFYKQELVNNGWNIKEVSKHRCYRGRGVYDVVSIWARKKDLCAYVSTQDVTQDKQEAKGKVTLLECSLSIYRDL